MRYARPMFDILIVQRFAIMTDFPKIPWQKYLLTRSRHRACFSMHDVVCLKESLNNLFMSSHALNVVPCSKLGRVHGPWLP